MIKYTATIFSLALASMVHFTHSNSFEKECMAGTTLEELYAMRDKQEKEIELSQAYRKKEICRKKFVQAEQTLKDAVIETLLNHSSFNEEEEKEYILLQAQNVASAERLLQYSKKRLNKSTKDYKNLLACISEKEYNEMVVTQNEAVNENN
jgi:hypothetical protein